MFINLYIFLFDVLNVDSGLLLYEANKEMNIKNMWKCAVKLTSKCEVNKFLNSEVIKRLY